MKTTIDYETHLIAPGNQAPKAVCLAWKTEIDLDIFIQAQIPEFMSGLLDVAMRGGATVIGHNMAFDMAVTCSNYPELIPLVFAAYRAGSIQCTMIREWLYDIAREGRIHKRKGYYGLAGLADRWLGWQLEKDHRQLMFGGLDGIPVSDWPPGYADYAQNDVKAPDRIYDAQTEACKDDPDILLDAPAQARAYFALYMVKAWGLVTDASAVRELEARVTSGRLALAGQLEEVGILRSNGSRDMKELRGLIEQVLGDETPRTPKGAVSTDKDTVALAAPHDPVLKIYAGYQEDANIISTFIPQLVKGTSEPLHPSYFMAKSGRTTCGKPNIQNQPRKPGVRECFIPRPGNVFVDCDYDTQEMFTLAQVCLWLFGHSQLAKALQAGIDPHLRLAAELLGISYELAEVGREEPEVQEARQVAKVANFGYPGGMGAHGFVGYAHSYDVEITEEASAKLRDNWFTAWPEMRDYFGHVSAQIGEISGGMIQAVSRRRRNPVSFTQCCNSYFQGLAADASKAAVFDVTMHCYARPDSPLYGCRPVAFVHDEILLEAPEEQAPAAGDELARVMVDAMRPYVPDFTPKATPALMRWWSKKAKTLRDEAGKLLVWEGE